MSFHSYCKQQSLQSIRSMQFYETLITHWPGREWLICIYAGLKEGELWLGRRSLSLVSSFIFSQKRPTISGSRVNAWAAGPCVRASRWECADCYWRLTCARPFGTNLRLTQSTDQKPVYYLSWHNPPYCAARPRDKKGAAHGPWMVAPWKGRPSRLYHWFTRTCVFPLVNA